MPDNVGHRPNRGDYEALPSGTTAAQSLAREGGEFRYPDNSPGTAGAAGTPRSGREVVCRLVRNSSGIALLGKRIVSYASSYRGKRVDGYTRTTNQAPAGVTDEYLPSGGVPNNALFLIVTKGPAMCLTDIAASANNVLTEGMLLGQLTAVTSQATTAGRIAPFGTLTTGHNVLLGIGHALTARTTANTNTDTLVDVNVLS